MGFIIKSIFWVGIVFLFLPRDPSALRTPKAVAKVSSATVLDAATAGANFCRSQPEICESALKTSAASREILSVAATTLSNTLSDKPKRKNAAN